MPGGKHAFVERRKAFLCNLSQTYRTSSSHIVRNGRIFVPCFLVENCKATNLEGVSASCFWNFVTIEEAAQTLSRWLQLRQSEYQHLLSEGFRKLLSSKCRQSNDEKLAANLIQKVVGHIKLYVEATRQILDTFSSSRASRKDLVIMQGWEIRESLKIFLMIRTGAQDAIGSMQDYKGPRIFCTQKRRVRQSILEFSQALINDVLIEKIIPYMKGMFESKT